MQHIITVAVENVASLLKLLIKIRDILQIDNL